jgi:hypothetical protein
LGLAACGLRLLADEADPDLLAATRIEVFNTGPPEA